MCAISSRFFSARVVDVTTEFAFLCFFAAAATVRQRHLNDDQPRQQKIPSVAYVWTFN
jgi:hypothetical protein